jgi:cytochrome c6
MQTNKCGTVAAIVRFSLIVVVAVLSITASRAEDNGAAIFKAKCAMCHGADGEGKTVMGAKFNIPSLSSPEIQKNSDPVLVEAITKGKNKMPEFGSKLSSSEITEAKNFVRKLKK